MKKLLAAVLALGSVAALACTGLYGAALLFFVSIDEMMFSDIDLSATTSNYLTLAGLFVLSVVLGAGAFFAIASDRSPQRELQAS